MATMNRDEAAAVQWLNDTTAVRREFSLPELASQAVPLSPLKKISAGERILSAGKFIATMRVALRQNARLAVGAVSRFLALIHPRLAAFLIPDALPGQSLGREVDEALMAASRLKQAQMDADTDGMRTPEEQSLLRSLAQDVMREAAEVAATIEAVPSPQLDLVRAS